MAAIVPCADDAERLGRHFGVPFEIQGPDASQTDLRAVVARLGVAALDNLQTAIPDQPDSSLPILGTRMAMWHALSTLESGERLMEGFTPRPHQKPELPKLILAAKMLEPDIAEDELSGALTRAFGAAPATGWGKTAAGLYLAHGVGVADPTLNVPAGLRPRMLVASSRSRVLDRMFNDPEQGIGKFMPWATRRLLVESRDSSIPDLDIVGVSYAHLARMSVQEFLELFYNRSLLWFDEAHNLFGPTVHARYPELVKGRLIFMTTATMDRDKLSLESMARDWPINITVSEALHEGIIRPIELWMIHSGVSFKPGIERGDFSAASLKELAINKQRNDLITSITAELVSDGVATIVSCIPGKDEEGTSCAHAELIAKMLTETEVEVMCPDGSVQLRHIVARVVKHDEPNSKAYIDAFEAGEVDVILVVDMLGEGFSSKRLGAVVHSRPHFAKWKYTQEIGRLFHPANGVAISIQIMDDVRLTPSSKVPLTNFGMVGLERIQQGIVLGRPENSRVAPPQGKRPPSSSSGHAKQGGTYHRTTSFGDAFKRIIPKNSTSPTSNTTLANYEKTHNLSGRLVATAYVGNTLQQVEIAPLDWVDVADLVSDTLPDDACMNIVLVEASKSRSKVEQPVIVTNPDGTRSIYVSPAGQAFLTGMRDILPISGDEIPLLTAARKAGVTRERLLAEIPGRFEWRRDESDVVVAIKTELLLQYMLEGPKPDERTSIIGAVMGVNEALRIKEGPGFVEVSQTKVKHVMNLLGWPSMPIAKPGEEVVAITSGNRRLVDTVDSWVVSALIEAFDTAAAVPDNATLLTEILPYLSSLTRKAPELQDAVAYFAAGGMSKKLRIAGSTKDIYVDTATLREMLRKSVPRVHGLLPMDTDGLLAELERQADERMKLTPPARLSAVEAADDAQHTDSKSPSRSGSDNARTRDRTDAPKDESGDDHSAHPAMLAPTSKPTQPASGTTSANLAHTPERGPENRIEQSARLSVSIVDFHSEGPVSRALERLLSDQALRGNPIRGILKKSAGYLTLEEVALLLEQKGRSHSESDVEEFIKWLGISTIQLVNGRHRFGLRTITQNYSARTSLCEFVIDITCLRDFLRIKEP